MDTQKRLHENISALADGELADSERELALAALDTAEGQAAWQAYHLAGDVLRDEASGALSDGFSASLAARLATEPAYTASATRAERGSGPSASTPDQAESPADVILP